MSKKWRKPQSNGTTNSVPPTANQPPSSPSNSTPPPNGERRSLRDSLRGLLGLGGGFSNTFEQRIVNAIENASAIRTSFLQRFFDDRRNLNDECGYPDPGSITADNLRDLYDREPLATAAIEIMPREAMQVLPMVYEDEDPNKITPFEEDWHNLGQQLYTEKSYYVDEEGVTIWEYLKRAMVRARIGHFGIILFGLGDGKNLQDPVDGMVDFITNGQGDSPITQPEIEAMRKWDWDGTVVKVKNAEGKEVEQEHSLRKLTSNESTVVDGWEKNKELTRNHSLSNPKNPDHPKWKRWVENQKRLAINRAGTPRDLGLAHDQIGARAPTGDVLLGREGNFAQYQPGLGMPGTQGFDLSGTESQYFGPVFGPSEYPTGEAATVPGVQHKPGQKEKDRRKLIFLRIFDETLVQIVRYEWNINNPRFGHPVMYRVTLNDPREQHTGVGLPLATVFVHWTRVQHVVPDGYSSSEIFGVPTLRPILNPILDYQKVRGSSAEGYYKMGFPGLAVTSQPQLGGDVNPTSLDSVRDQAEQYQNSLQRVMGFIGFDVKTLPPSVQDPTPFALLCIQQVCIQLRIPMRVMMGSERGELSSGQDDENWNDRKKEWQWSYAVPKVVVNFINRCITYGVVRPPKESYQIKVGDFDSLGEMDKAKIIQIKTGALAQYAQSGAEAAYPHDMYFQDVWGMDNEKVQEMMKALQDVQEEQQQENEDLADKQGFEPEPPEGFRDPPPEPGEEGAGSKGLPDQEAKEEKANENSATENVGWSDEARAASASARKASSKADRATGKLDDSKNQSRKPELTSEAADAHTTAATAHFEAARIHGEEGNTRTATQHLETARSHQGMVQFHKRILNQITENEWSDAAREASLEARRANMHPKEEAKPDTSSKDELFTSPFSKGTLGMYQHSDGTWDKSREPIHQKVLDSFKAKVTDQDIGKVLYMTGGGFGSGKSTLLDKFPEHVGFPTKSRAAVADPDAAKQYIPEMHERSKMGDKGAASYVHEESSYLAKQGVSQELAKGHSVIYDTSGDSGINSLHRKVEQYRNEGAIKVVAHYATPLSTNEAFRRAESRAQKTPEGFARRELTRAQVDINHRDVSRTWLAAAKKGTFDELHLWSTAGKFGNPPEKIAEARGGKIKVHNKEAFQKFVDMAK